MIRKLLLPAVLMGLLGGCVTDYGYRDGYYYGQPGVEYRYHDYYGYPAYGYGYYPYGERYRYYNYPYYGPYGYPSGYPYYGNYHYPRYRYYNQRPPTTQYPNPQPGTDPNAQRPHNDSRRPPWRNLNNFGRTDPPRVETPRPLAPIQTPSARPPRNDSGRDGSRMEQLMRRAQQQQRRNGERGETNDP